MLEDNGLNRLWILGCFACECFVCEVWNFLLYFTQQGDGVSACTEVVKKQATSRMEVKVSAAEASKPDEL